MTKGPNSLGMIVRITITLTIVIVVLLLASFVRADAQNNIQEIRQTSLLAALECEKMLTTTPGVFQTSAGTCFFGSIDKTTAKAFATLSLRNHEMIVVEAAASRAIDGQINRAWNLWRPQAEGKV
jgi:hypothetical protein